jgi:hypothetical protein
MSGLVVRVMKDYDAQYARGIEQPVWGKNSISVPERGKRKTF